MPSALMSDGPSFGQTSYREKDQAEKTILVDIIIIEEKEIESSMAVKLARMLVQPSGLPTAFEGQVV